MTATPGSRPATRDDEEFLYRLHRLAMGGYVEELYGPWDDKVQRGFHDRWFHPEATRVITVGDAAVGVLSFEDRGAEVYVSRIEVLPDWQNRGIGSAVLRGLLHDAGAAGKAVSLHVFSINPAVGLYRRLGFVVEDDRDGRLFMKWSSPR